AYDGRRWANWTNSANRPIGQVLREWCLRSNFRRPADTGSASWQWTELYDFRRRHFSVRQPNGRIAFSGRRSAREYFLFQPAGSGAELVGALPPRPGGAAHKRLTAQEMLYSRKAS